MMLVSERGNKRCNDSGMRRFLYTILARYIALIFCTSIYNSFGCLIITRWVQGSIGSIRRIMHSSSSL